MNPTVSGLTNTNDAATTSGAMTANVRSPCKIATTDNTIDRPPAPRLNGNHAKAERTATIRPAIPYTCPRSRTDDSCAYIALSPHDAWPYDAWPSTAIKLAARET